jgi:tyrosyl-tRNA synthetase
MMMMRLGSILEAQGDTVRSAEVAMRYFKSFPNMNFQYDIRVMPFIQMLISGGKLEEAKANMKILAEETADMMKFYDSLSPDDLASSFQQDKAFTLSGVKEIISILPQLKDAAFEEEIKKLLAKYNPAPVIN